MDQYKQRQLPRLLQSAKDTTFINMINDMIELEVNGKRMVVPSAEAFQRLVRRVVELEHRLSNVDNKATRAVRQHYG